MNKMLCNSFVYIVLLSFLVALSGCQSKPDAELYGSQDNLYGNEILDGDIPIAGDNLSMPSDGNRDMFAPVLFAYDSSQVSPEQAPKVEAVANYLKTNKKAGVIIEGHCDERGSREYNQALGERRALAVRDYLVNLGVDPSRIQTKSMGEEMPLDPGHDEQAWSKNRCGVFVIY